jgi:hypothetical protein
MIQPGRKYTAISGGYRYSINGQESEKDLDDNITSAEYWFYDSRVGRRWNVDPVMKEAESPYLTFSGNPILYSDPDGDDPLTDNPKEQRSINKYKRKYEKMQKKHKDWSQEKLFDEMDKKYKDKRWMWVLIDSKNDVGWDLNGNNSNYANYFHAGDLYRNSIGYKYPEGEVTTESQELDRVSYTVMRDAEDRFLHIETYAIPRSAVGGSVTFTLSSSVGTGAASVNQSNINLPTGREVSASFFEDNTVEILATRPVPAGRPTTMTINPVNTRAGSFYHVVITLARDPKEGSTFSHNADGARVVVTPPPRPKVSGPLIHEVFGKYNSTGNRLIHDAKRLNKETIKDLNKRRDELLKKYRR